MFAKIQGPNTRTQRDFSHKYFLLVFIGWLRVRGKVHRETEMGRYGLNVAALSAGGGGRTPVLPGAANVPDPRGCFLRPPAQLAAFLLPAPIHPGPAAHTGDTSLVLGEPGIVSHLCPK